MRNTRLFHKLCVLSVLGFLSMPASAATVSAEFAGNDCSGIFSGTSSGFEGCVISFDGVELSPVIAKLDIDDFGNVTYIETNQSLYPSIDGSEFTLSYDGDMSSGSFTYNGTAPDPNVRYWAAKAGPGFNLFWTVADSEVAAGGACETSTLNLACLQAAQDVFSGSWYTPGGKDLSHLTFYNHGVIPVPAAAWLFSSGLLGLIVIARRKRAA